MAAGVSILILGSELAHRLASRRAPQPDPAATTAVVVLGYPSRRDGRAKSIQRWRCQIAARTLTTLADDSVLIFSGGPSRGASESEAAVMARYALSHLGVARDRVAVEDRALTTWDNVAYSLPLAENAGQVAFASDPLHAERARHHLRTQRPDLAPRLVRADDYRFLERWWIKVPAVAYQVRLWLSDRGGPARCSPARLDASQSADS